MPVSKNRRKKTNKRTPSMRPKATTGMSTSPRSTTSMPSPLTAKQAPPTSASQAARSIKTTSSSRFLKHLINRTGIVRHDNLLYYYVGIFAAVFTGSVVAAGSFQVKPELLTILVAVLLNSALLGISSDNPSATPNATATHHIPSIRRIPLKIWMLWTVHVLFLSLFYLQAASPSVSHNSVSQSISLPSSTNEAPLLLALLTLASTIIIWSLPLLRANLARLVDPSRETTLSTALLTTTVSKPTHVIALTLGFSATMYILTILAVYTQAPDTIHYAVGFLGLTPSFWGAATIISQFENTLSAAGWRRSEQLTTAKGKKYSRPKGIALICALFLLFLPASVFALVALRHLPATFGAVLLLMLYTNKIMVEIFEKDFPLNNYTGKLQLAFILASCAMFVVGILSRS